MSKVDIVALQQELQHLEDFLNSNGFKAAKAVTEAEIQDGLDLIVMMDLNTEADLWKLLEARAEVRAQRKFVQRFIQRREQIHELLAKQKAPLDE